MKTLKRFIHYYAPYRAIFFLDLLCATVISAIDLAYPQILRTEGLRRKLLGKEHNNE